MSENFTFKSFMSIYSFDESINNKIDNYYLLTDTEEKKKISKDISLEIKKEYKRLSTLVNAHVKENLKRLKEEFINKVEELKYEEVERISLVHKTYSEIDKNSDKLYQKKYDDAISGEKIITKNI